MEKKKMAFRRPQQHVDKKSRKKNIHNMNTNQD